MIKFVRDRCDEIWQVSKRNATNRLDYDFIFKISRSTVE